MNNTVSPVSLFSSQIKSQPDKTPYYNGLPSFFCFVFSNSQLCSSEFCHRPARKAHFPATASDSGALVSLHPTKKVARNSRSFTCLIGLVFAFFFFGSSGKKGSVLGVERKPRDTHWFCFVLDEKLNSEPRLCVFSWNFLLGVVWLVRKLGSKRKF
jgi:hypothetical protein